MHARTHARTHARARAHTHTHTQTQGRSAQNNEVGAHILRITLTFFSVMFCFAGYKYNTKKKYSKN
jgi:hypothetical protein